MFINPAPLAATVADLRSGQHSLSLYLEQQSLRIDRVEPHIAALLPEPDRKARLLAQGRELTAKYPQPETRPPLFGCLLGVKDIIHADGFATQAGSTIPAENFIGPEAASVTILKEAGALVVGKTVTTEFAYFEPGPTRNPYDILHTPGGSSSGSAAAVAAGECTLALGTQTIGSVIRPAAYCGVVGFKATYDRIPTAGILYFSRTVDHVGLFTQDVDGMILAASVLCADWQGLPTIDRMPVLGVPIGPYLQQTQRDALGAFEHDLARLADAGVTVRRVTTLEEIEQLNALHRRLAFAEFAREHAELFPRFQQHYRPRTREIIELGRGVSDEELADLRTSCARVRDALHAQMADAGIDLWVCPAAPGPAPEGIHATGDPNMNLPWTHAGMPAITLPSSQDQSGMPLGLQLVAPFGRDEALLAYAAKLAPLVRPGS